MLVCESTYTNKRVVLLGGGYSVWCVEPLNKIEIRTYTSWIFRGLVNK